MEVIKFFNRYNKIYIGDKDYTFIDEHGKRIISYELKLSDILIKYFLKKYNYDIKELDIYEVIRNFNHYINFDIVDYNEKEKEFYNKLLQKHNGKFLIPNEFVNLTKVCYEYDMINDIYIEDNKVLDTVNCPNCNIILLNENMYIKKIICESLECKNCSFYYVKVSKGKMIRQSKFKELVIEKSFLRFDDRDIILTDLTIDKLVLRENSEINIKIINCEINDLIIVKNDKIHVILSECSVNTIYDYKYKNIKYIQHFMSNVKSIMDYKE